MTHRRALGRAGADEAMNDLVDAAVARREGLQAADIGEGQGEIGFAA